MTYDEFIRTAALEVERRGLHPYFVWDTTVYDLVRQGSKTFDVGTVKVWSDLDAVRRKRQKGWFERMAGLPPSLWSKDIWEVVYGAGYYCTLGQWHHHRHAGTEVRLLPPPGVGVAEARKMDKKVSIVTVSYNRKEYLRRSLAYFNATIEHESYELIAVDNGSTDGSRELLIEEAERGRITKLILRSRNHGTSPAYNCGFAAADPDTDFLMKMDSDICILGKGWVDSLVALFEANPTIGVLAFNQINHPKLRILPTEDVGGVEMIDWSRMVCGSCMTIRRKLFDSIGYFNEDFENLYMPDDVDYYVRLARKGFSAYYVKELLVYHQMYLDRTRYRAYARKKDVEAFMRAAGRAAVEYDRGSRPLEQFHDRYRGVSLPSGSIVEME